LEHWEKNWKKYKNGKMKDKGVIFFGFTHYSIIPSFHLSSSFHHSIVLGRDNA